MREIATSLLNKLKNYEMNQAEMERVLTETSQFFSTIEEEQILKWVRPHFVSCDFEKREWVSYYEVQEKYTNLSGVVLHGGMNGLFFDMAMGLLAVYYGKHVPSTISLNVEYLAPILIDEPLYIRAKMNKPGRTISYLTAEAFQMKDPTRILSTASASYFVMAAASPKLDKA